MNRLLILGTRGVPARHGGFETFAEQFSIELTRKGWQVGVYCQEDYSRNETIREEDWRGVTRILVPTRYGGSFGSLLFDWMCLRDAARRPGRLLVLGYNSAIFELISIYKRRPFIINMDGIEWKRPKWSLPIKAWLRLNEQVAGRTATTLIADHPKIESYLRGLFPRTPIAMIPYGACRISDASAAPLASLNLVPNDYFIAICRIEPDNSVLEMVQAFSADSRRCSLCIVGAMDEKTNKYHRLIRQASGPNVMFPGAIYDHDIIKSLRFHARAYCHGHRFGGTNPSLVEAIGAGNAIIAHDNPFSRWTAGEGQFYFSTIDDCRRIFDKLDEPDVDLSVARGKSVGRHYHGLTLEAMVEWYEALLLRPEHDDGGQE